MESPYSRPVAANLINKALIEHEESMAKMYCGYSREMTVYTTLREAGFLTEDAMVPCCESDEVCAGRQCAFGETKTAPLALGEEFMQATQDDSLLDKET